LRDEEAVKELKKSIHNANYMGLLIALVVIVKNTNF